ncbi:MAG TPA: RNA methyltransferase [Bacteroidales bacterium]|nr:RNA methyltransferase [Bacteroidales bacterium]
MLNRNKLKHILSLQKKKVREEEGLFVVEGDKIVREFLSSGMKVISLIAKPEFISGLPEDIAAVPGEIIPVSYEELKRASSLKTPHNAMAIVKMKEQAPEIKADHSSLTVVLDFIQDPGNLGTIIRAAAWFGLNRIVCSDTCVDVYNSKVIQATMGAILNVSVEYTSLESFLKNAREQDINVYGTVLDGNPVYEAETGRTGIILIGNESKGISESLFPFITHKITIPKFSTSDRGIESLNAGMAASVVFSEFRRRYPV